MSVAPKSYYATERPAGFTDFRLLVISVTAWAVVALEMSYQASLAVTVWLACICTLMAIALLKSKKNANLSRGKRHWHPPSSVRATVALLLIVISCVIMRAGIEIDAFRGHPLVEMQEQAHSPNNSAEGRTKKAVVWRSITCTLSVDSLPVPDHYGGFRAQGHIQGCQLPHRSKLSQSFTKPVIIRPYLGIVLTGAAVATFQRGESLTVRGRITDITPIRPGIIGKLRITHVIDHHDTGPDVRIPATMRAYTSHALDERSKETQSLLRGMGLGDKSVFRKDDMRAFQQSSLAHLVAVSGLHTGIIIGALTAFIPGRGTIKIVVSALLLILIIIVMGPSSSVIRACTMTALGLCAVWRGKGGQSGPGLAVAVMGMLMWNPWNAVSLSFALSVAATAGVMWPAQRAGRLMRQWINHSRMPQRLHYIVSSVGEALAVSVCAQGFTLPILGMYGMSVSFGSVIANVAVAPVVAPVCLGALVVVLVSVFSSTTADTLAWFLEPLCQWIFWVARFFGAP